MNLTANQEASLTALRTVLRERAPEPHLFTRPWNALTVRERRVCLTTLREWATEDATDGIMRDDPWRDHLEARVFLTYGEDALVDWREVRDDAAIDGDGCDPREAVFTATAEATRLRHRPRPRAAARVMLRRGGQCTVRARRGRLATTSA